MNRKTFSLIQWFSLTQDQSEKFDFNFKGTELFDAMVYTNILLQNRPWIKTV